MKKNKEKTEEIKIDLDMGYFNWGVKEASYFVGFISTLKNLNLTDGAVENIILTKMSLDYDKENLKLQIDSNEFLAKTIATIQSSNYNTED